MPSGTYKTDDLALAVFLSTCGFEYKLLPLTKRVRLWEFNIPGERDDEFDDLIADYDQFEATIEPRKFVARWAEMRQELFLSLGITSNRRSVPAT